MYCDRCKKQIVLLKPLNTCNIVTGENYQMTTYVLCRKCTEDMFEFLGEKRSNMPKELEFWYKSEE